MSDRRLILGPMNQRQPSGAEDVICGAILAESLRPGTEFDGHGMRIVRCARYEGDQAGREEAQAHGCMLALIATEG